MAVNTSTMAGNVSKEQAKVDKAEGAKLEEQAAANQKNLADQAALVLAQNLREESRQRKERIETTAARLEAESAEAASVAADAERLQAEAAALEAKQAKGRPDDAGL